MRDSDGGGGGGGSAIGRAGVGRRRNAINKRADVRGRARAIGPPGIIK